MNNDNRYKEISNQLDTLINEFGKTKVALELKISRPTLYSIIKNPEKMTIQNVLDLQGFYNSYITFKDRKYF